MSIFPTLLFQSVAVILWSKFAMIQLSQKAAKGTIVLSGRERESLLYFIVVLDVTITTLLLCEGDNDVKDETKTTQILMSWDSTIFAKVFLTRRMVRRDAGLWAQHSDISFNMALKHWGNKLLLDHELHLCSAHIYLTLQIVTKSVNILQIYCHLLDDSPHHCSICWTQWAAVLWRTQPQAYPHKTDLMAPSHNMVPDSPQRYLENNSLITSSLNSASIHNRKVSFEIILDQNT